MKKNEATLVEKLILLIIILICLAALLVSIVLFDIYNQKGIKSPEIAVFAAISVITIIVLGIIADKWIIIPFRKYKDLFKRFINGQIYQEFLDNACHVFPGMKEALQRFDTAIDRQKVIQLSTKQAEFLALQNQINPHFLYNTLEAIRGDALCAGMDNIADITEALSTFFRYTITETGSLVTMADELENVDNYFKIQKYRFGDKLEIECEILENEDEILQLQCPKLMLQPIIENAIFHGLEKKPEGGTVRIRIELSGSKVLISIKDNGVGIGEEELSAINEKLEHVSIAHVAENKKAGIALKNVCRRIKLLFGEEFGVHVYSLPEVGTDVRITLPIIKKTQEYNDEGRTDSN